MRLDTGKERKGLVGSDDGYAVQTEVSSKIQYDGLNQSLLAIMTTSTGDVQKPLC